MSTFYHKIFMIHCILALHLKFDLNKEVIRYK